MSKQKLVVMSLSQLACPAISEEISINEFVSAKGYKYSFVKATMILDLYAPVIAPCLFTSNINLYKLGTLNYEQFCDGIRRRLWVSDQTLLTNDEIKQCWNKMCEIPEAQYPIIKDFIKFLRENNEYRVVFANETNKLQMDYIQKQLQQRLTADEYRIFNERCFNINSHDLHQFGKQNIAIVGVQQLQKECLLEKNQNIDVVVSMHWSINSNSVLDIGYHEGIVADRLTLQVRTTLNIAEEMKALPQAIANGWSSPQGIKID